MKTNENRTILRILGKRGRTTIPFLFRQILGMGYNTILSYTLDDDKIIIKTEKLCDNCQASKAEQAELTEFIYSLSTEEKYHALALLSKTIRQEHGREENNS